MDEKKWMDSIKDSAENVKIPESLQPDQIVKMLEEKTAQKPETVVQEKKPVWCRRLLQGLSTAAAAAIVFAAGHQTGVMSGRNNDRLVSMVEREIAETAAEEETAAKNETEETAAETERKTAEKTVKQETAVETEKGKPEEETEEGIKTVGSQDALYAKLKSYMDDREEMMNQVRVETLDIAAESSMDMGTGGIYESQINDFSQTNLRDAGVDESDIVKTDGEYIYIIKQSGSVKIVQADGTELTEIAAVESDNLNESVRDLYVDGDSMILVTGGSRSSMKKEKEDVYTTEYYDYARVLTYDISDRAKPKLLGSSEQEGYFSGSRKVGNDIYLFTEFHPQVGESQDDSRIMPLINGESMTAEQIYTPEILQNTSYLVIGSVNTGTPDQIQNCKAVVSGVEHFYVSSENIYICNRNWRNGSGDATEILKFSYKNGKIKGVGTCEFKGYLNDTFSIDEYDGYLRVLATEWTENGERNTLYVYDEKLQLTGKLGDIAPDESVRSARFLGNTGYFVTFRRTDPLFSVDLSDPKNPQIIGALKIDGFSSYLHFYGEDRLLGIGYDADPETGATTGIKLSMFDISDPSNVTELKRFVLKDANSCPGLYDYRMIMIDPEKNLFGFACDVNYLVFTYEEEKGFVNLLTYNMAQGSGNTYGWYSGVRGLYIGKTFYLADEKQILAFDMDEEFALKGKLLL